MTNKPPITKQDFDSLLSWLSPDTDQAAVVYEKIRLGLIRYFRFRGCPEAESLTDETFNRVMRKLSVVEFDENINKSNYFYSFASLIFREDYARRRKTADKTVELVHFVKERLENAGKEKNSSIECLETCLAKESPQFGELLLDYYSAAKGEKRQMRKKLAAELDISLELLHSRVARMRNVLRECLKNCLTKKKSE
jgi:DNA-directed RNA polymerase specialized sigma24 family protein